MALFGFRTRNPNRDRETDYGRFDRMISLLHALQEEVEKERNGLQARCQQAQSSAAFALDAFENGGGDDLAAQADSLGARMQRYQERVVALERQKAFMQKVELEMQSFRDTLSKP